jgi:4-diphosphocytidyl-2C-methyl-D-erythritol kinase
MLRALNLQWGLGWTAAQLEPIAASIGSDVPFFLHAPSAICSGRGEVIRPIRPPSAAQWAMLVLPPISLSTPSVYRRFDEMALGAPLLSTRPAGEVAEEAVSEWSSRISLPSDALLPMLCNDLEPAAFSLRPDLQALREAIERTLDGRPVRMSGSGSALFTLYDEPSPARAAAEQVRRAHGVPALAVSVAPITGLEGGPGPKGGAAENGSS